MNGKKKFFKNYYLSVCKTHIKPFTVQCAGLVTRELSIEDKYSIGYIKMEYVKTWMFTSFFFSKFIFLLTFRSLRA